MAHTENKVIEYIILDKDLVDGKFVRAKKKKKYKIIFEDDYAVYFIGENDLSCGLTKNVVTHKYKKIQEKQ